MKESLETDNCKECGGSGWVPYFDEEDNVMRMKKCKCHPLITGKGRLKFASIPEKYKNMQRCDTKESIYNQPESRAGISKCLEGINKYMINFDTFKTANKSLYLWSKVKGSGKTRMLCCIANELIKDYRVKFATSTAILQEIKATWDRNSEYTESRLIDDLVNAEILMIDDFGIEKPVDWINNKFYHIINERYIHNRLTFFTSNESIATLNYDDRIKNRIRENVIEIHFPEESVRDVIAKRDKDKFIQDVMKGIDK